MGRWRNTAISAVVLLLGLGLRVLDPPVAVELQERTFDFLQQMAPRPYTPVPVRVVDIDDASLTKLGQWPWPRTMLADLIERLQRLGAAVVALDIVLAEPDRSSPARALQQLPAAPAEFAQWIAGLPDHDRVLADAIAKAPVVTGFALTSDGGGRAPAAKAGFSHAGDDPAQFVPLYRGAVTDLPGLEAAGTGNGALNLVPYRDQIVRRVPLILRYGDTLYPSLAAEALRVAQHEDSFLVRASGASAVLSFGQQTGITDIRVGDRSIRTDAAGAIWLYDTGRVAQRRIPAWKIMDGSVPESELKGAIVFVGVGAAGLSDLKTTPLATSVPGVEVHAQIAEQALLGTFLRRPDWAAGAEMLYLLALGLVLILGLPRFGAAVGAAFTGVVIALAFASSWYAFTAANLLFAPVYPSIVALLVYLSSSLLNQLQTEAEKRRVRTAFAHYLSPVLVEQLANDPSKLRLGGELRRMTFLFSDIRGFTSIAEQCKARPEALTDVVNRFMTRMTAAIFASDGTIDKYIGDCVMAFWNAPLDQPDHAARACEAALAMRRELVRLNDELAAEAATAGADGTLPRSRLESGIGINTGDCIVGNLGSEMRLSYSVIGDAVNLASRLEGESKTYGVPIVIGEETERAAEGFATLELDLVAVKGKRELTRIFALLGGRETGNDPDFQALRRDHANMLAAYRAQEWELARALIDRCCRFDFGMAAFYELYRARITAYERNPSPALLPGAGG